MDLATATEIFIQAQTAFDSPISDLQIGGLATKMVRWEDFAPFFALSEAEQEEIRRNNERNYQQQKRAALCAWREKHGRQATYRSFLSEVERANERWSPGSVLGNFHQYLIECYSSAVHISQDSWSFSDTSAYIDLPLFVAPLTQQKPGEGAQALASVDLNSIFLTGSRKAKRKVVLLEGVAGCGKTTLTWHACKEWAEGRLFQQFPLLIHVSLDDPAIQNATRLADIIPHPSSETREAVAAAIAEHHGEGVCFILDGWDEASLAVQQRSSFICKFIAGSMGQVLPQCSIVVTSRPSASYLLNSYLTCKVKIGRLNKPQINDFIESCLPPEESEELLKVLEQKPQLANLCYLPINVTIVIFLFRCGVQSLPETQTGLFKALTRNLLIRHMQLRTRYGLQDVNELDDLPEDIFMAVKALSSLAFTGTMQHRWVFESAVPSDTLSLIEYRQQLTSFGSSGSCRFLHYSVQEFLAAWHMSRLGSEEQAKAVSDILHSSPLSPVLPFFAGLTGLSNPAVRAVLLEVTRCPLDYVSLLGNRPQTQAADKRCLALALLNCICESQNSSLCEHIACPSSLYSDPFKASLSFQLLSLEPTDCLSIGYFLANHTSCLLDVQHCSIGDAGVKAMMMQLKQSAEMSTLSRSTRWLDLAGNPITSARCMGMVGDVVRTALLTSITFVSCWLPTQVERNLTYLIEGLSRRTTSFVLGLDEAFTSAHTHYLVLLITTCPLRVLHLSGSIGGERFSLLAEALKQNTALKALVLDKCSIGASGLLALGRKARTSLRFLVVLRNGFTSLTVKKFLQYQRLSQLQILDIGRPLIQEEIVIFKQLQRYRLLSNIPQLAVRQHYTVAFNVALAMAQIDYLLPTKGQQTRRN